ncbi:MAG: acid phosphatase [Verrucomicrobia bacterium]|nr:acid phosphatase [Verrucomicrobiota bacterium]
MFAVVVFAGCTTVSREPPNLYPHKQEIRAYVDSGAYDRDIASVARRARSWLETRATPVGGAQGGRIDGALGGRGGGKLAMVFDLDETLLSNWPQLSALDFGYLPAAWDAWVDAGTAPAIEPVRDLYRAARRLGVEVIFITGRLERDRAGTEKNLRAIDCADYAMLICKPDNSQETSGAFKLGQRRRLVAGGRIIIANVGDQESDLAGGFAERTFKLPNPFYLTP